MSNVMVLLQTPQQRWLQAAGNGWNLAQGEWAQHSGLRGWRWIQFAWRSVRFDEAWQASRRGLALLLLVNLLGLNLWAWQVQAQVNAQRDSLNALLMNTFPQVKVVIDAPIQMRREVEALQKNSALPRDADMDVMLQVLSAPWPSGAVPTQIDYQGGTLSLGGLKADALDALRQAHGQSTPHRTQFARERQLAGKHMALQSFWVEQATGSQDAHGDGQIESPRILGQIGRRQIDRDALVAGKI
jgi:general secretion pathway protein L